MQYRLIFQVGVPKRSWEDPSTSLTLKLVITLKNMRNKFQRTRNRIRGRMNRGIDRRTDGRINRRINWEANKAAKKGAIMIRAHDQPCSKFEPPCNLVDMWKIRKGGHRCSPLQGLVREALPLQGSNLLRKMLHPIITTETDGHKLPTRDSRARHSQEGSITLHLNPLFSY